jgi:hypothetical protein
LFIPHFSFFAIDISRAETVEARGEERKEMKQIKWKGTRAFLMGISYYLVFPGLVLVCSYSFWALPCRDCLATWLLKLASVFLVLGALGTLLIDLLLLPRDIYQDGGKIAYGNFTYRQIKNFSEALMVVAGIMILLWLFAQIAWALIRLFAV